MAERKISIVGGTGLAGGVETFNARLKEHLTQSGYVVEMFPSNSYLKSGARVAALRAYLRSAWTAAIAVHRQRPDHVLVSCANFFDVLVAALIATVARPKDLIVVPHFNESWGFWRRKPCVRIVQWVARRSRFFAIAPSQAQYLESQRIRTEAEIFPNFFNYQPPSGLDGVQAAEDSAFVALYVGRMVPEKRVDKAALYLSKLATAQRKIRLNLVGGIDPELQAKISALATPDFDIHFLGQKDAMGVSHEMHKADAFVSFSASDTLPLTYLEAAAHGLPVLTLDNPVTRDVQALTDGVYFVDPDAGSESDLDSFDTTPAQSRAQAFAAVVQQQGRVVLDLISAGRVA